MLPQLGDSRAGQLNGPPMGTAGARFLVPFSLRARASGARTALTACVLLLHATGIWLLNKGSVAKSEQQSPPVLIVELLRVEAGHVAPSFAEPVLETPGISDIPLPEFRTESDPGVHLSAPQVDISMHVDPAPYAHSAGLHAGQSAAVILLIDVLSDGSTGDVSVKITGGTPVIDEAAIAYVRALRWIPAVLDGKTVKSRILFGVNLTGSQS